MELTIWQYFFPIIKQRNRVIIESPDVSFSDIPASQTASAQTFREGANLRYLNLESLFGVTSEGWESLNLTSASVKVQTSTDSGANWTDITASGFEGLLPTEYTLNTLQAQVGHRFGFRIHEDAIDSDINYNATNRLRFLATIGDGMATRQVVIPFTAASAVSFSSLAATTNATAKTYREGASLDTFNLADLIAAITDWGEIHLDSAEAELQFSDDSGATWEEHTTTEEGLATTEYTLNTDALLSDGDLGFRLHADSIANDLPHDGADRFRIYVTLTEGGVNRYVSIPVSLLAPVALTDLPATTTLSAQTFREGATQTVIDLVASISEITARSDLNLDSVTAVVQSSDDSGATWTDMGVLGFEGLLPTEYTLDTDDLLSDLEVGFRIHAAAISADIEHDAEDRLRILITLDDGIS